MTTYTEIKRLTGNNKAFAAIALNVLTETCWWTNEWKCEVIYLRNSENDWVAIPAAYEDEGVEFTTVNGASVILTADENTYKLIAVEVEE